MYQPFARFHPNYITLPKTNKSPLNMDGWNTIVSLWEGPFSGPSHPPSRGGWTWALKLLMEVRCRWRWLLTLEPTGTPGTKVIHRDIVPIFMGIIINHYLGGGFKYFYFHPYLGKIPSLTNIFQMGWNHQLAGCDYLGEITCLVARSMMEYFPYILNEERAKELQNLQTSPGLSMGLRDGCPCLTFKRGAKGDHGKMRLAKVSQLRVTWPHAQCAM